MKLTSLHIAGFKSIDANQGQTITLGDITVLLGVNGSGKSNLLSFFSLLQALATGKLDSYVGRYGVNRLLHYGTKQTQVLKFQLKFDDGALNIYQPKLTLSVPDRLQFEGELVASDPCKLQFEDELIEFGQHPPMEGVPFIPRYHKTENQNCISEYYHLHANNRHEAGLLEDKNVTGIGIRNFLKNIRSYQFHDTSETAKIKDRCYIDDCAFLYSDAGNLAAFLRRLKITPEYKKYYQRIVSFIRSIMPQFGDFDLEPLPGNKDYIRLNWRDVSGGEYLFDSHQLSDGTLRFMALTTLLLQPPDLMPTLIILDEPELGLHPAAISAFAAMVNLASEHCQLLLATQSTRLVDEFEADNLIIAVQDKSKRASVYRRLKGKQLKSWLKRYSLSELWEKNVLGDQV